MNADRAIRRTAALALVTMATSAAGASIAHADDEVANTDVTVNVEIDESDGPGLLSLSVAGGQVTLLEDGSDDLRRQFTGTLPTVTVTDTRGAEDIPDGVNWSVVGVATDFVNSDETATISADHLGWTPTLIDGGDEGLVAAGDQVDTVLDGDGDNVGLVSRELLFSTWDSAEVAPEGHWSASADLFLRVPTDVTPGSYSSNITLSLFE